jgi:hypothetical protein
VEEARGKTFRPSDIRISALAIDSTTTTTVHDVNLRDDVVERLS